MNNDNTPVVLCEDDYRKLSDLMNLGNKAHAEHEMTLAHEIGRAIVVKNSAFPANTIRIGSIVKIKDLSNNKEKEFQIVLPADADIKTRKISVLSPMSAAIIGFRVGDEVSWKMPSGLKKLQILDVKTLAPAE